MHLLNQQVDLSQNNSAQIINKNELTSSAILQYHQNVDQNSNFNETKEIDKIISFYKRKIREAIEVMKQGIINS